MTQNRHPNGKHRADDPDRPLTEKEELFVLHYYGAANLVAAEAAKLAGYAAGTRAGQTQMGFEVSHRPAVRKRLDAEREGRANKLRVTAEDVLRDLLILKAEATPLKNTSANMKTRLAIIQTIGDHVQVAAFRHQLGLGNPTGGPIETVDLAMLAGLSDEELDHLERAREILDRRAGRETDDTEREDVTG